MSSHSLKVRLPRCHFTLITDATFFLSEQGALTSDFINKISDRKPLEDIIRQSSNYPKVSLRFVVLLGRGVHPGNQLSSRLLRSVDMSVTTGTTTQAYRLNTFSTGLLQINFLTSAMMMEPPAALFFLM